MSDLTEKLITVISYKTFGQGKVGELVFTDPAGHEQKMKAWASEEWEAGQERTVYFQEKEKYGTTTGEMEWWVNAPKERKPASTGNTGARRGNSPGTTREDFLGKWDKDREAKTITDSSIVAQVILKCAVEINIANAKHVPEDVDPNAVKRTASDLAAIYQDTQGEIFDYLKGFTTQDGNA